MFSRFRLFALPLALCLSSACYAEVKFPRVIGDHAVLQRDAPLHIWGWATPHARLSVKLHAQEQTTTADDLGKWSVWFKPEAAGGPYVLTVDGDGHAEIHDLLLGDVWLASGQSNMEFPLKGFPNGPLKDSEREIAAANRPDIRLLVIPKRPSDYPMDDVEGKGWTTCTPETVAEFSAVAYFFGVNIQKSEKAPIGLIDATWGGTPAESWVSMDTLGSNPALFPILRSRAEFAAMESDRVLRAALETKAEAGAKAAGKMPAKRSGHADPGSWMPAGLFNGMIAPATPYTLRGWLWYQGESNTPSVKASNYAALFQALIGDWRQQFSQGNLPFLFVQISSFVAPQQRWGMVRDAQRRALVLKNTAMAVSLDVGEAHNIHPADKQTVGYRLALAAQGLAYGEHVEFESPTIRQTTVEGEGLRIWLDHAKGLHAVGELDDFEVAGADHVFVPAKAIIDGESVVVSAGQVKQPRYVRFAWADNDRSSLRNEANLPAGTFTSEPLPLPQ